MQVILHGYDGVRKRGYGVINTICYALEHFTGKRDTVGILTAAAHDRVLPCTWVLPPGVRNTAAVFEAWFEHKLLASLVPGYTIILDNAPWHRKAQLRALAHACGINVLFLPAYCPEWNWVELCFAWLKQDVKQQDRTIHELTHAALDSLARIPARVMNGFVRHCGYKLP